MHFHELFSPRSEKLPIPGGAARTVRVVAREDGAHLGGAAETSGACSLAIRSRSKKVTRQVETRVFEPRGTARGGRERTVVAAVVQDKNISRMKMRRGGRWGTAPCLLGDVLRHGADVAETSIAVDARAHEFAASEAGSRGRRAGGGTGAVTAQARASGGRYPSRGGCCGHHVLSC